MITTDILWILFFLFLALDILFSVVRASMVYLRLPHLVSQRDQNFEAVERTMKLLERPHLSATLRLGVAWMHFLLAGFSLLLILQMMQPDPNLWQVVLLLLLAGLLVLFLEFTVEGIILRNVEIWALRLTPVASLMDWIFRPFSWILTAVLGSPQVMQRSLGSVTEDELKTWVEQSSSEGSLEIGERRMIASIFHFSDTLCREIMVPRIDVSSLDINTSVAQAVEAVNQSGHSRFPVYEENIDNIVGLLYAKDLLSLKNGEDRSIRSLLRTAYFVPEAKKVDELLREMQARGVHMSVVVDEYGGMAGVVTLEDIVEEIVGEIRDEYDEKEELLFQEVNPDEYIFHGRIDLEDFNEIVGTHLQKDVADTLGGFIYGKIGRVPVGGEELDAEGWRLIVEQVSGRRIWTVRARRIQPGTQEEEQEYVNEQ